MTRAAHPRPLIHVLSLGGTIAMAGREREGVAPVITADALVASAPGVQDVADVDAEQFLQLPGASLSIEHVQQLARHITQLLADGATGVVVTQGTDTIDETAFLLDILVDADEPVVVTGAMRHPALPGADGPANILGAILVAADPAARGHGTLVVMNDEIHAARFVAKRHTARPSAFASPLAGPIGWIAEGRSQFLLGVSDRCVLPGALDADPAPVALLTVSLGDDARMAGTLPGLGYRGAVVEAFGGGHVPDRAVPALATLAGAMPVVLASRTGAGPVLHRTYGFPGSEMDLLERGMINAGVLDGPKARLLLAVGLGMGLDRAELGSALRSYGSTT